MIAVSGYYNGREYVSLEKADIKPNQKVIITILNDFLDKKTTETKPYEKYIGKLDNESFLEISEILQDCEKVDKNEW